MVSNGTTAILSFLILTMLGLIAWVTAVNLNTFDFEVLRSLPLRQGSEADQPAPEPSLEVRPIERTREVPVVRPQRGTTSPFNQ